jgi:hypothetical protein
LKKKQERKKEKGGVIVKAYSNYQSLTGEPLIEGLFYALIHHQGFAALTPGYYLSPLRG